MKLAAARKLRLEWYLPRSSPRLFVRVDAGGSGIIVDTNAEVIFASMHGFFLGARAQAQARAKLKQGCKGPNRKEV